MDKRRLYLGAALLIVLAMVSACTPTEQEGEPPLVESPADQTPVSETPAVETPAAETPIVETPEAETPVAADNELIGTSWTLVSFGAPGSEKAVIEDTTVTLQFESATQLGGSGGCNSYGSEYNVENGMLEVGDIVSTLMACAEEGITEQEQRYFEALRTAGSFTQTDERLTISYDEGQSVLNFVPLKSSGEDS